MGGIFEARCDVNVDIDEQLARIVLIMISITIAIDNDDVAIAHRSISIRPTDVFELVLVANIVNVLN